MEGEHLSKVTPESIVEDGTALSEKYSAKINTGYFTKTMTIAAGATVEGTVSCKSEGYSPLGVASFNLIGTNADRCNITQMSIGNAADNLVHYRIRNMHSSSVSATLALLVLRAKIN